MHNMKEFPVALDNIGGGAAIELFSREMERVLENIWDVNTSDKAKRSITLKVEIKPTADRGMGSVEITCKSTLASVKGFETRMFFGRDAGKLIAVEHDPKQPGLPFYGEPVKEAVPSVSTLRKVN